MDPVQNPPEYSAYPSQLAPADSSVDLRRMWHAMRERIWLIEVSLVVCIALGFLYLRRAPILYTSTATIQVQADQAPIIRNNNSRYEDSESVDFLQTVAQSLKTRSLLERVAQTNHLAANAFFAPSTNAPLSTNGPLSNSDIARELDRAVTVKLRRGTRLIDVTVVHRSSVLTSKIANSLVGEYISENQEQHVTTAEVANESLIREAERLRKKLQDSENALQQYREETKSVSLDDRQNTVVAGLKELSTRVNGAKSTRILLETDYSQVSNLGTNSDALMTLASVAENPAVVGAKLSLSRAENDFAAIRQRYKQKHPKFIQAQTQLLALRDDLSHSVLKATQTLKSSLDAARFAETALENVLQKQETSALELDKLSIHYNVLTRELESDRALYDAVLRTMKETSVSKEIKPMRIRVVEPAITPDKPFSPRQAMILALSVMMGLAIGVGGALGLSFLDSTIKTVDEAESLLGLPVFSAIAKLKEITKQHHPLMVVDAPHSTGAEAFRTLRTNLAMLWPLDDRLVFLFTSAMPQEGKTFTSVNYAASLAQVGLKTLIIDGDLRRPTVESTLLDKDVESLGVTDVMTGKNKFEEVVQPTKLPNLFYISGGTTAPNPAELLARDGLNSLISRALQDYDRVVVDSAPIHAVSDTLLMLKNVQTVCLVVSAARTSRRSVIRCIQLLQAANAPLSGLVLNRMTVRRRLGYGYDSGYYDYGYHGKYSKKGVYGAKKD